MGVPFHNGKVRLGARALHYIPNWPMSDLTLVVWMSMLVDEGHSPAQALLVVAVDLARFLQLGHELVDALGVILCL